MQRDRLGGQEVQSIIVGLKSLPPVLIVSKYLPTAMHSEDHQTFTVCSQVLILRLERLALTIDVENVS